MTDQLQQFLDVPIENIGSYQTHVRSLTRVYQHSKMCELTTQLPEVLNLATTSCGMGNR